jgi:UDP-N-acetylglucosamine 2-epimerase (non-hydrolysing)
MKKPIVIVIGTRPDAIKSVPVYLELKNVGFRVILVATFQQRELLQQVLDLFQVVPDVSLGIMKKEQSLFYLTRSISRRMERVLQKLDPKLVLVHGDTTTAFTTALSAFYLKIPIGHMEAGLRTGNPFSPFPEEINRKFISSVATYHFAPTSLNVANLLSERIERNKIYCTGNVVIDALRWILQKIQSKEILIDEKITATVSSCKKKRMKLVLLTAHRRESFDGGLERIFVAIKKFLSLHDDVFIFYPYHPNPSVLYAIEKSEFKNTKNILLMPPLLYKNLIYIMSHVCWVMTDSGGIHEEATSMGKKVLILRDVTERIESIWEKNGKLVGTNPAHILQGMLEYHSYENIGKAFSEITYGDGNAAKRIVSILKTKFTERTVTIEDNNNKLKTLGIH